MKLSILVIIIFSSISAFGQDQFTPPKSKLFNDLAFTYGYSLAQKARVQKLSITYPYLSIELANAQMLWERSFQPSVDSIEKVFLSKYGTRVRTSIDSSLKIQLANENLSVLETNNFISQIRSRTEGKMESPIIETLLSYNPIFSRHPDEEISSNFIKRYSSFKHKDMSYGIDIRMKLPQSWNTRDTQLPGIIRGFSSKNGRGNVSISIMLIDLKNEIDKSLKANPKSNISEIVFNDSQLKTIVKNPRNIKRTKVFLNRIPSNSVEFVGETLQLQSLVTIFQHSYYVIKEKKLFVLNFSVAKDIDESEVLFNQTISRNRSLFEIIASNLILIYPEK